MSVSGRVNILGAKWRTGVCEARSRGYHAKNDGRCGVAVCMENVCLWYAPDDRCVESRRLTARFGLRCSEALCLKREHIEINSDEPHINVAGNDPHCRHDRFLLVVVTNHCRLGAGNMKSPDKVYFRPQDIKWMEILLKKGYKVQRRRKHKHGTCHFEECFKIPETGAWGISMASSVGMMIFFDRVIFSDVPFESSTKNHGERWREMFFSRWDFLVNFVPSCPCWVEVEHSSSNPKKKKNLGSLGFLEVVGVKKGVLGWIIFDI